MFDWKKLYSHLFGPKDHIKKRCPIDGFPMHLEDGVYRCSKGHTIDPNKVSPVDGLTEASKGHKSGEI